MCSPLYQSGIPDFETAIERAGDLGSDAFYIAAHSTVLADRQVTHTPDRRAVNKAVYDQIAFL